MESKAVKLERLEEILMVTPEGTVVIKGNNNPTNEQIGQAVKRYARQFKALDQIHKSTAFQLRKPHPKISDKSGTTKTKEGWIESCNIDEPLFEVLSKTGYLSKV